MADNGMQSFSAHATEGSTLQGISGALGEAGTEDDDREQIEIDGFRDFGGAALDVATPSTEEMARIYLDRAIRSDDLPLVSAEPLGDHQPEFRSLGVEEIPLTGTQTVKFRQEYDDVPVYGSLVTVELDESNELLALNTSTGSPTNVDPTPSISPEDALRVATGDGASGGAKGAETAHEAKLNYYYDRPHERWRLAYIVKDCLTPSAEESAVEVADVVVDAHNGQIVARLPRVQSVEELVDNAEDDLGKSRRIVFTRTQDAKILADEDLRVETYDFDFKDIQAQRQLLPGTSVVNPPEPWEPAAVSAHANAALVATFIRKVLKREGLNGQGSKYRSTVRCTKGGGQEWRNAAWRVDQMVYGQRLVAGVLRSYAVSTEIVAHEMFHGLTSATSRLEYVGMTGAMNESYSDIFGVIVSNWERPLVANWDWQIGEDLDGTGIPLRDLSDPTLRAQPAHMDQYKRQPLTQSGDWGGVHSNSGIHNKVAHTLLTVLGRGGQPVFTPAQVAAMFYLALTQHLGRTSTFGNSRRGVVLAARTLLRSDARLPAKIEVIEAAFSAVGITDDT